MAKENLAVYERIDSRRLFEITTGDETWIQYKPPIRKQNGKVWLKRGELPPAACMCHFRAPKVLYYIFFDGLGPVTQVPVPKGRTLTAQFYPSAIQRDDFEHS